MGVTYKVSSVVDYLMEHLECSQKAVAHYTGLNPSTISNNIDKELDEVATTKTGRRLILLSLAVNFLAQKGISSSYIKEIITESVFEDYKGSSDSVVSAIIEEKYGSSVILNIAQLSLNGFLHKLVQREEAQANFLKQFDRIAV